MGHYANAEDLTRRLPAAAIAQLTTEAGEDEGAVDDAVSAILVEVEGLVDSKLRALGMITPVVVPADSPDGIAIQSNVLSIAKFLLLSRRGMSAYDPAAETLFNAAMSWLKSPGLADAPRATAKRSDAATRIGAGSDARKWGDGETPSAMRGL